MYVSFFRTSFRGTFSECDESSCSLSHCSNREFCSLLGNEPQHYYREVERVTPSISGSDALGIELLAARSYRAGAKIILYIGVAITSGQANETRDCDYVAMCGGSLLFDAKRRGNASRYANSSHAPNCILEEWKVKGTDQIGLIACKAIAAGEAITWWYGLNYGRDINCACGAATCGGKMSDPAKKNYKV